VTDPRAGEPASERVLGWTFLACGCTLVAISIATGDLLFAGIWVAFCAGGLVYRRWGDG
jgi:hypothetical protein